MTYNLSVKVVVFDNGTLGMVKLEQEQGGLPAFGTTLDNPDLAAVALALGLQARRVTNPDEVSVPAKVKLAQGWGYAVAKVKEEIISA